MTPLSLSTWKRITDALFVVAWIANTVVVIMDAWTGGWGVAATRMMFVAALGGLWWLLHETAAFVAAQTASVNALRQEQAAFHDAMMARVLRDAVVSVTVAKDTQRTH